MSYSDIKDPGSTSTTPAFSDTVNVDLCRAIVCDAAGDIVVTYADDSQDTFTVVAGQILPLRLKRIDATLTTVAAGSVHFIY